MNADFTITYEESGSKGRYTVTASGIEGEGELTFSRVSDVLIIADHTVVPDSMRGLGAARALVERLIADSREKGQRIVPLCPYVRAQAQKHPEWNDVIQR
ncbi:MAG: GNAT family N-acetyltransferase [Pseudomonadota bacterium]